MKSCWRCSYALTWPEPEEGFWQARNALLNANGEMGWKITAKSSIPGMQMVKWVKEMGERNMEYWDPDRVTLSKPMECWDRSGQWKQGCRSKPACCFGSLGQPWARLTKQQQEQWYSQSPAGSGTTDYWMVQIKDGRLHQARLWKFNADSPFLSM